MLTPQLRSSRKCVIEPTGLSCQNVASANDLAIGKHTRVADAGRVRKWMQASLKPV
jgi:hypothetical protein